MSKKTFRLRDDALLVKCYWDESGCWVATLKDEDSNQPTDVFAGTGETREEALAHLVTCWYYNPLGESHWEEE